MFHIYIYIYVNICYVVCFLNRTCQAISSKTRKGSLTCIFCIRWHLLAWLEKNHGKWRTDPGHMMSYGYGSIPINTIFNGMNIHLPAILGFTRYQGFDPSPYGRTIICKHWVSPKSSEIERYSNGLCKRKPFCGPLAFTNLARYPDASSFGNRNTWYTFKEPLASSLARSWPRVAMCVLVWIGAMDMDLWPVGFSHWSRP